MTLISIEAYTLFLQLNQAMLGSRTYGCSVAISKQVMSYLADHVDRPFNSEALGRHLNLNYSYISTVFRRETGQSVIEAHTKLRLNKAIEFMRESDLNIAEIGERLGFHNLFYFSRVFKKVLGFSPTEYRKRFY